MINICKKKLKYFKSVKLIQCDVSKGLPFKNGTFDFVYAIRVLKYVNEFEYVLSEINRVLKRNGILVFSMPNKYSINSLNIFRKIPYRRISKNELLRILEENGFSVVRIEGGPKLPDFLYDISNKLLFLRTILLIEQFLKRLLGLEFSRTFFILTIKIKKVNQYYER
jgi:SAM-dependent methyltransferase